MSANAVNFIADRFQIAQTQVNDGVADVSHFVKLTQLIDDDIADDTTRYLGAASLPNGVLHTLDDPVYIFSGDGTSRACNAQP